MLYICIIYFASSFELQALEFLNECVILNLSYRFVKNSDCY